MPNNSNKITTEQIDFLKSFYNTHGCKYCSGHLDMPEWKIKYEAKKLNLRVNPEVGRKNLSISRKTSLGSLDYVINMDLFYNITRSDVACFLGFLWADGTINSGRIDIEINSDDAEVLKPLFFTMGKWQENHRQRYQNGEKFGRLMTSFGLSDREFYNFLEKFSYHEKSTTSPFKILSHIPPEFHLEFWHGYFDGDGSVYFHKEKKNNIQLSFWGDFTQDWSALEYFLQSYKIEYRFQFYQRKKENGKIHSSSCLMICKNIWRKKLAQLFLSCSCIGLLRKRKTLTEMFELICEKEDKHNTFQSKTITEITAIQKCLDEGMTNFSEIAQKLGFKYNRVLTLKRKLSKQNTPFNLSPKL